MLKKIVLIFSFLLMSFSFAYTRQQVPNLSVTQISSNNNTVFFSYKEKVFLSLSVNNTNISPNNSIGLASQTEFQFHQFNKNIKIRYWELKITDNNFKEVFISSGTEFPNENITWNANNGNSFVEGNFKYFFKIIVNKEEISVDGNITVDGTLPYVLLQTSMDTIVISEDKLLKELAIASNVGDETGIDFNKTSLQILNEKNIPVKSWDLKNKDFQNIFWDGKDDIYNELVKPGEYKIVSTAYDLTGNYNKTEKKLTVIRCDLKGDISDIVVKEEPLALLVDLSSVILFSSGSCNINEEALSLLDQTVDLLKVYQANKVLIEGYTDDSETKDPLLLSYIRAQAVYAYLVKEGIQAERLQAVGYGEENPIASNENLEEKAKNRRVNIVILKKEEKTESDLDEKEMEENEEIIENNLEE